MDNHWNWTSALILIPHPVNSKVLLEGLYDPDCPLNKLQRGRGGQDVLWIVWKLIIKDWQVFGGTPFHHYHYHRPCHHHQNCH